jgi:hypothetical protein
LHSWTRFLRWQRKQVLKRSRICASRSRASSGSPISTPTCSPRNTVGPSAHIRSRRGMTIRYWSSHVALLKPGRPGCMSEGRRADPQGHFREARDREGGQLPCFTWRSLRCQTAQLEDLDAGFDEIAHRTGVAFPRICAQQTRTSVVRRANLSLTARANGRRSSACARSSRSLIQPR